MKKIFTAILISGAIAFSSCTQTTCATYAKVDTTQDLKKSERM